MIHLAEQNKRKISWSMHLRATVHATWSMFHYTNDNSSAPHTASGPLLRSPIGDNSNLIMDPSLSSNKAQDHFTIYHMGFNPSIGLPACRVFKKLSRYVPQPCFNGKKKAHLHYRVLKIRDELYRACNTKIL